MPGIARFLTCEAHYALILCNFVKRYCVFDNTPRDQTVSIDRVILEAPCWLFRTVSSHGSLLLSSFYFFLAQTVGGRTFQNANAKLALVSARTPLIPRHADLALSVRTEL